MPTILLAALSLAADPVEATRTAEDARAAEGAALSTTPSADGFLVFDAHLPAEVLVDGEPVAQLYRAARVRVEVPAGIHRVRVYTNGSPNDLEVVVPAGGELPVLVGRMGLSVDPKSKPVGAPTDVVAGDIPVQVRMSDRTGARLLIDKKRYTVTAGKQLELQLPTGEHDLSVRSEDGTVVWATGTLKVDGPDPVIVQLSEGRLPEVSGRGAFSSRQ